MDTGKHTGHGCVMLLYSKLCESIWEGSPATQQLTQQLASSLESGVITATLQADGDADIATASSESPTDTSSKKGDVSNNDSLTESQSLHVKQRRNLLDNKLNNYKQEKLKRKLSKYGQLLEYAKEDIEMKKRLMNHIVLVLDFLFYQDCLYLNKICFHSSKCVVCCPCQLLLFCIAPIHNMSVKLLKSQVCENMANPIWRLPLDAGDNLQRAFLTRSCRSQRFNPDHLMLVHNFHIQTFPPFVTFVLPRIDLRLR